LDFEKELLVKLDELEKRIEALEDKAIRGA
jgi:hypothetical protein